MKKEITEQTEITEHTEYILIGFLLSPLCPFMQRLPDRKANVPTAGWENRRQVLLEWFR